MQVKRQKIISVSPENRKKLIKKYQCSQTTVYQALRYVTNTKRAEDIRKDALEMFGGKVNRKLVMND